MELEEFLENIKQHITTLQNYIKSQKEFIAEEEKRFDQLAWDSVTQELTRAKKHTEGYQPNSEQLNKIEEKKKLLDQYLKEDERANSFEIGCLTYELEHLENGYSESEITEQIYNSYYEFAKNNFTAMFEQYTGKATLMLVYSVFELYLKKMCVVLGSISHKKVYNFKIRECIKYLIYDCKVKKSIFNANALHWQVLNTIKNLRDLIVHNNSIVNSKKLDKINKIKTTFADKITLYNDKNGDVHIIYFSEEFFTMTLENIVKFFEEIVKSKQLKTP